jgi:hypothetical protein
MWWYLGKAADHHRHLGLGEVPSMIVFGQDEGDRIAALVDSNLRIDVGNLGGFPADLTIEQSPVRHEGDWLQQTMLANVFGKSFDVFPRRRRKYRAGRMQCGHCHG